MSPDLRTLDKTVDWFKEAVPNPTQKSAQVQIGCHLEEVSEMLLELAGQDSSTQYLIAEAFQAVSSLADRLKASAQIVVLVNDDSRVPMLDALCDQMVTATGIAHMLNMNIIGGLTEVNESNFSKFDKDGKAIFGPTGKILKGADYSPPDLTNFV